MNKIVKDAFVMTVITLISGCLLGFVYEITKEPIAKAQEEKQQKAYQTVFDTADSFVEYEKFDLKEAENIVAESGYSENTINHIVVAKDNAEDLLGYVFTVTSHSGYAGDITFSVGITKDGTVTGYSITSIGETAGLGMKAKEEPFSSQFAGVQTDHFEVIKEKGTAENQIEAISGATITSNAMANGVNVCLAYYQKVIGGGQ